MTEEEEEERYKQANVAARLWFDGLISGYEYIFRIEEVMTPQNIISIIEMTKELHLEHFLANAQDSIDPFYRMKNNLVSIGTTSKYLLDSQKLNIRLAYLVLLEKYKKA